MTSNTVTLSFDGPIATLTLNRPDTLNSISEQLTIDAREALAEVRETKSVRALILTGAGRAFCAGAELNESLVNGDGAQSAGESLNATMRDQTNPLIVDLKTLPVPVVAAVNGAAAGAGVGFALAADITIAARSASFILTFGPKLGLVPDVGTTWHLPRRIGTARAMALSLLGNKLSAAQAEQWGLIWQCVDDDQLHATALQLARTLASSPSHIALELRQAIAQSASNTLEEQLDYERERQCVMVEKPTFREGVRAFREKRAPVFD
ncbi:enoyl-CoA hydratase-related protein [Ralstonia insidiosa]|uniref:Enoyl-CoA hydratase n=1 Tax=Ralstonia insidiosa TaxID=190721 RepID=A0A848P057_9RALS|nr:enoyl-CoA hydratase-related protein [Ralstonia insidiosa]NMV38074.1 enoyl-CoA hydratase [Ralstonia insidiosa]